MIGHRSCDASLLSAALRERFVQLEDDAQARGFVARWRDRPHGLWRSTAHRWLRRFVTDFEASGLLGMYPMHLLSTSQLGRLLEVDPRHPGRRLLDVGAGDGGITARAAPLFTEIVCTEASAAMRRRLRRRGFRVEHWDLATDACPERFGAIQCLNVLDRCHHPLRLIEHLRDALEPRGRLLLSVPLPLRAHVDLGSVTVDPDEPLPASTGSWEGDANTLAAEVLEPAALVVRALGRAPYLCRGDAWRPLSALDAAVFASTRAGD